MLSAHMMIKRSDRVPDLQVAGCSTLITTVHNEFEKSATLMGLGTRVIAVSDVVGASMQRRGVVLKVERSC